MAPPDRRGGGQKGRGRSRGGGGGGRAPGTGVVATVPASSTAATTTGAVGGTGDSKHKADKAKHRKGGNGPRGGSAPAARPARTGTLVARKVLIRNIPHDVPEATVLDAIAAHGVPREYVWRFVAGKVRGNNRAPRSARMYLDFKKDTMLAKKLIESLNGYTFHDAKDAARLDVDFAPFQKVPREKQRKDTKAGTIDRDPEFLAFLEDLAKPNEKLPSADMVADAKDGDGMEKPVAALVQYLNERKGKGKAKFGSKSADKGRCNRSKTAKDGRGSKEKIKVVKGKGKLVDPSSTKDASKNRKPRGKSMAKEAGDNKAGTTTEPGALRIMGPKVRGGAPLSGCSQARSDPPTVESEQKGKPVRGLGKGGPRRGPSQVPKELSNHVPDTAGAAAGKEPKIRGRRDTRSSKTHKSGQGGRGEQKKIFVPKVTQSGV